MFTAMADELCVMRYKVEEMPERWREILSYFGVRTEFPARMPTYMNTYQHKIPKQLTWQDLYDCDKDMAHDIMERSKEYGYEVGSA